MSAEAADGDEPNVRIGLIAPPWESVPPHAYGGTEAVIDNLARGLDARGHDVLLFTVADSTCPVPRAAHFPSAAAPMGASAAEAAHVIAAYDTMRDARLDVIHDHTLLGPLFGAGRVTGVPIVTTMHLGLTPEVRRILAATVRAGITLVAISRSQRELLGELPVAAVIHHGIDLALHPAGTGSGGHLVFVGRMCADKGPHRAIAVARQAGRPLVIITKMREPEELAYYEHEVRPLLAPDVRVRVEVGDAERVATVGDAIALLNPIAWDEPFGLVMAEALACGTPVLAFPRGAATEIVRHGRNGFLCADERAMADAVRAIGAISREACRADAERRFSAARMTSDYERLYASLDAPRPAAPRVVG